MAIYIYADYIHIRTHIYADYRYIHKRRDMHGHIHIRVYVYIRRACSYPNPYPVFQACLLGGEEAAAAIEI